MKIYGRDYRSTMILVLAMATVLSPSGGNASARAASTASHTKIASKKLSALEAKDQEIAVLQAKINQLEANLARAQDQIDALETASVPASKPSAQVSLPIAISDVRAQLFESTDMSSNPTWLITFEIKNDGLVSVPFPRVSLVCNDNYSTYASRYAGHTGMGVVDPATILPGQDTHLKYSFEPLSGTEQPTSINVYFGSSSITAPVALGNAP